MIFYLTFTHISAHRLKNIYVFGTANTHVSEMTFSSKILAKPNMTKTIIELVWRSFLTVK